jgi:hypothetical protein
MGGDPRVKPGECRKVCGETRLEIPARSLAAATARLSRRGATLSAALYLEAGRGFEQPRHIFLARNDRSLARLVHGHEMADEIGPFERHG